MIDGKPQTDSVLASGSGFSIQFWPRPLQRVTRLSGGLAVSESCRSMAHLLPIWTNNVNSVPVFRVSPSNGYFLLMPRTTHLTHNIINVLTDTQWTIMNQLTQTWKPQIMVVVLYCNTNIAYLLICRVSTKGKNWQIFGIGLMSPSWASLVIWECR